MNVIADGDCAVGKNVFVFLNVFAAFDLKTETDRSQRKNDYIKKQTDKLLPEPEPPLSVYIRV